MVTGSASATSLWVAVSLARKVIDFTYGRATLLETAERESRSERVTPPEPNSLLNWPRRGVRGLRASQFHPNGETV